MSAHHIAGYMRPSDYDDVATTPGADVLRSSLEISGSGRDWHVVRRTRRSFLESEAGHASTDDHTEPHPVAGVRLQGSTTSFIDSTLSPPLHAAADLLIATAAVLNAPLGESALRRLLKALHRHRPVRPRLPFRTPIYARALTTARCSVEATGALSIRHVHDATFVAVGS